MESYHYSVYHSFLFYLIDFFLYLLIGLYLNNVVPTARGYRQSLLFFLQPSYWCPGCGGSKRLSQDEGSVKVSSSFLGQIQADQLISVRGLRKVYSRGKVAVDGIDLDLYPNHIFALLGHSGAGKSTVVSVLSGTVRPTAGTASAFGADMFRTLESLKGDLGVCQEYDVFFEQLTVLENLEVFARLKNISSSIMLEAETHRLLEQFKLVSEQDKFPQALTPAMKRKLSLAIAFLGNPRIIFLDEPTSGMDAVMRKEMWGILNLYKRDRILFLTTHYMDEADELGDRIGILSQGRIVCCDTAMALKKQFGIGYHLTIDREEEPDLSVDILKFVAKHVPDSEVTLNIGRQLKLRLPFVQQDKYKSLFTELDTALPQLGITSYGVTITTLEDVFMKVDDDASASTSAAMHWKETVYRRLKEKGKEEGEYASALLEGAQRIGCEQLTTMIGARIKEAARSPSRVFFTLIIPLALVAVGILSYRQLTATINSHLYSVRNDFPESYVYSNNETVVTENYSTQPQDILYLYPPRSGQKVNFVPVAKHNETYRSIDELANLIQTSEFTVPKYGAYYFYEANAKSRQYTVLTLFNLTYVQSAIAFITEIANCILSDQAGIKVSAGITQMHVANIDKDTSARVGEVLRFLTFFAFAMTFIPGMLVSKIVLERRRQIKQSLVAAGLPLWVYWASHFIVDTLSLYIPIGFIIVFDSIFDVPVPRIARTHMCVVNQGLGLPDGVPSRALRLRPLLQRPLPF